MALEGLPQGISMENYIKMEKYDEKSSKRKGHPKCKRKRRYYNNICS
jgi:hypothetical protein